MTSPTSIHSPIMTSPTANGPYLNPFDAHIAELTRQNQELHRELMQSQEQNKALIYRYNLLTGAPPHNEAFRQERERRARARMVYLCSPNRNGISS